MNPFKSKKHTVKVLNPKKLLQLCPSVILPFCLTGCMGIYEGGFECPPGKGVGCKSISEVNSMVDQLSVISNQSSESTPHKTEHHESICETGSPGSCPAISEIWYSPFFKVDQQEKSKNKVFDAQDSI